MVLKNQGGITVEKSEKIENRIVWRLNDYLHSCMPVGREQNATLIYEMCFFRLLSIRTFKEISFIDS